MFDPADLASRSRDREAIAQAAAKRRATADVVNARDELLDTLAVVVKTKHDQGVRPPVPGPPLTSRVDPTVPIDEPLLHPAVVAASQRLTEALSAAGDGT